VFAAQLPSKKPTPHSVGLVKNFLLEIGRSEAIIQCDNEPAIKLLLQRVVADMGLLKLQYAAPYSSASMGSVERFHASLQGQVRTLLSDLEEKTGFKANGESPITSWAIRHASWLQTRFMTHATDKKTSYFRRWERGYTHAIGGFSEVVRFRKQGYSQPKLTSQWSVGLWVGRSTSSDEHIVLHESEIFRTRTVRRLAPSKQWDPQRVQGLRVFASEFSAPTERLQLPTSDIPPERGDGGTFSGTSACNPGSGRAETTSTGGC